jgi:hypothetical protein
MLKLFIVLAALTGMTSIATAQWITQERGGAFDDDPLTVSLTARQGYALGLRCKSNISEVMFVTQDRSFDRSTLKAANLVGPQLLIRIDRGEILKLKAKIDNIDDQAVFIADADLSLYRSIADAKTSISVVVELLGEKYHENSFGVTGTRTAMNNLMNKCKLQVKN